MRELIILATIGAGTLAMRALFLLTPIALPTSVERVMGHARPAILAALVGGFLAGGEGGINVATIGALAVTVVLARRGANMLVILTVALGLAFLLP
jgi:branched-subunit amino acid transport protein